MGTKNKILSIGEKQIINHGDAEFLEWKFSLRIGEKKIIIHGDGEFLRGHFFF